MGSSAVSDQGLCEQYFLGEELLAGSQLLQGTVVLFLSASWS